MLEVERWRMILLVVFREGVSTRCCDRPLLRKSCARVGRSSEFGFAWRRVVIGSCVDSESEVSACSWLIRILAVFS